MKRLRPLKAKIKVIKRSGTRNVYIPLTIGNRSQSTSTALRQTATQNDNFSKESSTSCANWESDHSTDGLTQHQRKLRTRILNWERVRESLLQAHIEESSFLAGFCSLCNENDAVCRCVSCGPRQQFCLDCAKQLHSTRNQFHLLEICKDGVFLPMYPDHCVVRYGHRCSTQNNRHVTLVDEFGVQHVKQVQFCNCESPAVTLIRCNFWPGSPERPVVGFSLKLMNLAEMLFLQSQVSLHDFTEVIKRLQHPLQPTVISSIYNILNSSCFDEFRYFKYHLKHLHKYCSGLNDGFTCPLCPKSDGVVIESMDACMGLTRKKAKGTNVGQPRHGTLVFSDQDDVDNFVDNYTDDATKPQEDCSRFHAGEIFTALRSKGKNQLFDEKGVFGRVCRHDFPKGFLNLKHGERISYSVYELKKMREELGHDSKLIVMYDIACLLEKHLKMASNPPGMKMRTIRKMHGTVLIDGMLSETE